MSENPFKLVGSKKTRPDNILASGPMDGGAAQEMVSIDGWELDAANRADMIDFIQKSKLLRENVRDDINGLVSLAGQVRAEVNDNSQEGTPLELLTAIQENSLRAAMASLQEKKNLLAIDMARCEDWKRLLLKYYPGIANEKDVLQRVGGIFTKDDEKTYKIFEGSIEKNEVLAVEINATLQKGNDLLGEVLAHTAHDHGMPNNIKKSDFKDLPTDLPIDTVEPNSLLKEEDEAHFEQLRELLGLFATDESQADTLANEVNQQFETLRKDSPGIMKTTGMKDLQSRLNVTSDQLMQDAKVAHQYLNDKKSLLELPSDNAFKYFGQQSAFLDLASMPKGLAGDIKNMPKAKKLSAGWTIGTYAAVVSSVALSVMSFNVTANSLQDILGGMSEESTRAYDDELNKLHKAWVAGGKKGTEPGLTDKIQHLKLDGLELPFIGEVWGEHTLLESILAEMKVLGYGLSSLSLVTIMWLRAKEDKNWKHMIVLLTAMGVSIGPAISFMAVLLASAQAGGIMGDSVGKEYSLFNDSLTELGAKLTVMQKGVTAAINEIVRFEIYDSENKGPGPNAYTLRCTLNGCAPVTLGQNIWSEWDTWIANTKKSNSGLSIEKRKLKRIQLLEKNLFDVLQLQKSEKFKHLFDGGRRADVLLANYNEEQIGDGSLIKRIKKDGMVGILDSLQEGIDTLETKSITSGYSRLIKLSESAKIVTGKGVATDALLPEFAARAMHDLDGTKYLGTVPITTQLTRGMRDLNGMLGNIADKYSILRGGRVSGLTAFMDAAPKAVRDKSKEVAGKVISAMPETSEVAIDNKALETALNNVLKTAKSYKNGYDVMIDPKGREMVFKQLGITEDLYQTLAGVGAAIGVIYIDTFPGSFFTGKFIFGMGPVWGGNNNKRRRRLESSFEEGKEHIHLLEQKIARPLARRLQDHLMSTLVLQGHQVAPVLQSLPVDVLEMYVIRQMRIRSLKMRTEGPENSFLKKVPGFIDGILGVGSLEREEERDLYEGYEAFLQEAAQDLKSLSKKGVKIDEVTSNSLVTQILADVTGSKGTLTAAAELNRVTNKRGSQQGDMDGAARAFLTSAEIVNAKVLDEILLTLRHQKIKMEVYLQAQEGGEDEDGQVGDFAYGVVLRKGMRVSAGEVDYDAAIKSSAIREYLQAFTDTEEMLVALGASTNDSSDTALNQAYSMLDLDVVDSALAKRGIDTVVQSKDSLSRRTEAQAKEYVGAFNTLIGSVSEALHAETGPIATLPGLLKPVMLASQTITVDVIEPATGSGELTVRIVITDEVGNVVSLAEYESEDALISIGGGDIQKEASQIMEKLTKWLQKDGPAVRHLQANYLYYMMSKAERGFREHYVKGDSFTTKYVIDKDLTKDTVVVEDIISNKDIAYLAVEGSFAISMHEFSTYVLNTPTKDQWKGSGYDSLENIQMRFLLSDKILSQYDESYFFVAEKLFESAMNDLKVIRTVLGVVSTDASINVPEGLVFSISLDRSEYGEAKKGYHINMTFQDNSVGIIYPEQGQNDLVGEIAKAINSIT